MLSRKRFIIVKYVLLDMLKEDKVITIDEVMRRVNNELLDDKQMDRKTTMRTIVSVIESARSKHD